MNHPDKLIILGAGRCSVEILDMLEVLANQGKGPVHEFLGFLDDNEALWGGTVAAARVLGPLSAALDFTDCWFLNGIASPAHFWMKERIILRTAIPLNRFITLVHPSASVSRSAVLGRGTLVFQNVTIGSHATIGNHVLVGPNSLVSHDAVIGDYTSITGGVCISGGTQIGASCYLGINCAIREHVKVGDSSLIGMGGVVVRDVAENSVVFGNPAQFQRHARPPRSDEPTAGEESW